MNKNNKIKNKKIINLRLKNNMVETIYNKEEEKTSFVIKKENGKIEEVEDVEINGKKYTPFSPESGLINRGVLILPSNLEDYKSKDILVQEIRDFIHSYSDISEHFEVVSAYYILMSWVFERFDNVPYLRVRGNPGRGKSRYLNVISSILYNSVFFKAGQSESSIFRTLDLTKASLVIDEADFRYSGKTSDLVKLLNNGFEQGSIITRSKPTQDGGYEAEYFDVFGPKVLGNRTIFEDDALESRCISEYMGKVKVRDEVLVKLGDEFQSRAKSLRNKLLKFRLENFDKIESMSPNEIKFKSSNRSKQILVGLATLMNDSDLTHLEKAIRVTEESLNDMRDNSLDVDVIKILLLAISEGKNSIRISEIANDINNSNSDWDKISPKKIGNVLSNLNISKKRGGTGGGTLVDLRENKKKVEFQADYHSVEIEDIKNSQGSWSDELEVTEDSELSELQRRDRIKEKLSEMKVFKNIS